MTDQFQKSMDFWEDFIAIIERLDLANRHIPWDDPDIKKHGIIHLVERQELEKELTAIRDRYANTFDDLIAEHDPDTQIHRHIEKPIASFIDNYTAAITLHTKDDKRPRF